MDKVQNEFEFEGKKSESFEQRTAKLNQESADLSRRFNQMQEESERASAHSQSLAKVAASLQKQVRLLGYQTPESFIFAWC